MRMPGKKVLIALQNRICALFSHWRQCGGHVSVIWIDMDDPARSDSGSTGRQSAARINTVDILRTALMVVIPSQRRSAW